MTENKDDAVTKALDKLKPIVSKLGFGGTVGYMSGMATKTVGRAVAILGGMTFIALQSAAYMGYLNINWGQIKDSAVSKIDTVSTKSSDFSLWGETLLGRTIYCNLYIGYYLGMQWRSVMHD
jgi:uncharacterized membrane protein (Fun14 family)